MKKEDTGPSSEAVENALHGHGPCGTVSRWLYKQRRVLAQVYHLYREALKIGDATGRESTASIDDLPEMYRPKNNAELYLLTAVVTDMNRNSTMMWALDSLSTLGATGLKIYRPTASAAELMIHTDLTVLGSDVHLPFDTVLLEIPEELRERFVITTNDQDMEMFASLPEKMRKYLGYPPMEELRQVMHPRFVTLREMHQKGTRSLVINVFAGEWFRTDLHAESFSVAVDGRLHTFNELHALSVSPIPVLGIRSFIKDDKTLEETFEEACAVEPSEHDNIALTEAESMGARDLYRFAINSMLSLMLLDFTTKQNDIPKVARKISNRADRQEVERVVPSEINLDQTIFINAPGAGSEGSSQSHGTGDRDVKPHWRRGHWRRVAVGAGRTGREYRFIKPVFVNLKRLTEEGFDLKDTTVEIKNGG